MGPPCPFYPRSLFVHAVDGCGCRRSVGYQNANTWLALVDRRLSYTAGVIFFAIDSRLQYAHLIWHLFVFAGTTCHYFAVPLVCRLTFLRHVHSDPTHQSMFCCQKSCGGYCEILVALPQIACMLPRSFGFKP
jgi:hypothetical protein